MYIGIQLLAFFIVTGQFGFPVASQFLVAAEAASLCVGNYKLLCCRLESSSPSRKFKIKRDERSVKKVVCYGEGDRSSKKQCPNGLLGYCCPPETDPKSRDAKKCSFSDNWRTQNIPAPNTEQTPVGGKKPSFCKTGWKKRGVRSRDDANFQSEDREEATTPYSNGGYNIALADLEPTAPELDFIGEEDMASGC